MLTWLATVQKSQAKQLYGVISLKFLKEKYILTFTATKFSVKEYSLDIHLVALVHSGYRDEGRGVLNDELDSELERRSWFFFYVAEGRGQNL